jgi:hypothetical protein
MRLNRTKKWNTPDQLQLLLVLLSRSTKGLHEEQTTNPIDGSRTLTPETTVVTITVQITVETIVTPFVVEDEDSAEAVLDAEDLIKEKEAQILGNAIFAIRRGIPQLSALTLKLSGICKQKTKLRKHHISLIQEL